jgi:RHS repeat-associated protein
VLSRARTYTFSRRAPQNLGEVVPFDEDGDLRSECSDTNLIVDGYGNVRRNVKSCGSSAHEISFDRLETLTEFDEDRTAWLISSPELITIKSTVASQTQTQIIDPEYDLGLLQSVTRDPNGDRQRSRYLRGAFGNVERVIEDVATGEEPRTTEITYDSEGVFPRTITNAKGHVTSVSVEPQFGQVATVVDPNGIAHQREFDGFGKITKVVTPSEVTVFSFGSLPHTPRVTLAGTVHPRLRLVAETRGHAETPGQEGTFGGHSIQELDNYGRVVRRTVTGFGGQEVISDQAYDARGLLIGSTLPHLSSLALPPTEVYAYDYLGRLTRAEHSDGSFSETHYASTVSLAAGAPPWLDGLTCRVADLTRCGVDVEFSIGTRFDGEPEKRSVVVRDYAGRVVRTIDGKNVDTAAETSNFDYAPFGRLRQLRDNANAVTVFDHDPYGRLLVHVDPDSGVTQYTYNGFGEMATATDPKLDVKTYTYDVLGRLEQVADSAGLTKWKYDPDADNLGRLSETLSPTGQAVIYEYEPVSATSRRGLLQQITYAIDGDTYDVGLQYDDLGRPEFIDYPTPSSGAPIRVEYEYDDASGTLVGLKEVGAGSSRSIWHLDSAYEGHLIAQQTFGNGAVSSFSYYADRRRLNSATTQLNGDVIQNLEYSYYGNGQVSERITPARTQEYTYDPLGRLDTLTNIGAGFSSAPHQFGYDSHGNLTINDGVTNHFPAPTPHLPGTIGANDYTFDDNGNLESRIGPDVPGGKQTFVYTPFDMPSRVVTGNANPRSTYFDYTADQERVVRRDPDTGTTRHFAGDLYQRLLSSPQGATLEERYRLYAGGGVVAEIVRKPASEVTLYFHDDHLGTPTTISGRDGNVTQQEFDPFGKLVGPVPGLNQDLSRIGFTAHDQDNDLGLIDMGGRVYDPLAGRFTTADPIMQAPYFSQGQNRYAYVFNDPINLTDPSGFATQQNDFTNAVHVATDPAVMSSAALVASAPSSLARGLALNGGLAGVSSVGNAVLTLAINPFGARGGSSYSVAGPTGAATSSVAKPNGIHAVGQGQPLSSPVQERSPAQHAAGPKNSGPDPMLCQSGMFECDYEAQTMRLKQGYIPAPDGTTLVQMGQAVQAAANAVWRWLRPPPPPALPIGAPNVQVINAIKALPDGARLTPQQITELGKNVDAVLRKSLPAKIRSGRPQDTLNLFRSDSRFRFIDQVPGARQHIVNAFKAIGIKF